MSNLDYCTISTKHNIENVLNNPATSFWLKDALQKALERDCVDAVNDAEALYNTLDSVCKDILKKGGEKNNEELVEGEEPTSRDKLYKAIFGHYPETHIKN